MSGYTLVRSRRKTLAIHVLPGGAVEVRAPLRLAGAEIDRFVASKAAWIEAARRRVAERQAAQPRPLPPPVYEQAAFACAVRALVAEWARRLGVAVSAVGLRAMTSRWGSCTPKTGRIRLNTALARCPRACLEYIVVHELAHLREPNHSGRFWAVVESALPDYKARQKALRDLQWILNSPNAGERGDMS